MSNENSNLNPNGTTHQQEDQNILNAVNDQQSNSGNDQTASPAPNDPAEALDTLIATLNEQIARVSIEWSRLLAAHAALTGPPARQSATRQSQLASELDHLKQQLGFAHVTLKAVNDLRNTPVTAPALSSGTQPANS